MRGFGRIGKNARRGAESRKEVRARDFAIRVRTKNFRVFVSVEWDERFGKLRGKRQRNARTRLHAGAWGLRRCDATRTAGDTPEDSMDSTMESNLLWVYRNIWNSFLWCIKV